MVNGISGVPFSFSKRHLDRQWVNFPAPPDVF
jgi:hypothetical protein